MAHIRVVRSGVDQQDERDNTVQNTAGRGGSLRGISNTGYHRDEEEGSEEEEDTHSSEEQEEEPGDEEMVEDEDPDEDDDDRRRTLETAQQRQHRRQRQRRKTNLKWALCLYILPAALVLVGLMIAIIVLQVVYFIEGEELDKVKASLTTSKSMYTTGIHRTTTFKLPTLSTLVSSTTKLPPTTPSSTVLPGNRGLDEDPLKPAVDHEIPEFPPYVAPPNYNPTPNSGAALPINGPQSPGPEDSKPQPLGPPVPAVGNNPHEVPIEGPQGADEQEPPVKSEVEPTVFRETPFRGPPIGPPAAPGPPSISRPDVVPSDHTTTTESPNNPIEAPKKNITEEEFPEIFVPPEPEKGPIGPQTDLPPTPPPLVPLFKEISPTTIKTTVPTKPPTIKSTQSNIAVHQSSFWPTDMVSAITTVEDEAEVERLKARTEDLRMILIWLILILFAVGIFLIAGAFSIYKGWCCKYDIQSKYEQYDCCFRLCKSSEGYSSNNSRRNSPQEIIQMDDIHREYERDHSDLDNTDDEREDSDNEYYNSERRRRRYNHLNNQRSHHSSRRNPRDITNGEVTQIFIIPSGFEPPPTYAQTMGISSDRNDEDNNNNNQHLGQGQVINDSSPRGRSRNRLSSLPTYEEAQSDIVLSPEHFNQITSGGSIPTRTLLNYLRSANRGVQTLSGTHYLSRPGIPAHMLQSEYAIASRPSRNSRRNSSSRNSRRSSSSRNIDNISYTPTMRRSSGRNINQVQSISQRIPQEPGRMDRSPRRQSRESPRRSRRESPRRAQRPLPRRSSRDQPRRGDRQAPSPRLRSQSSPNTNSALAPASNHRHNYQVNNQRSSSSSESSTSPVELERTQCATNDTSFQPVLGDSIEDTSSSLRTPVHIVTNEATVLSSNQTSNHSNVIHVSHTNTCQSPITSTASLSQDHRRGPSISSNLSRLSCSSIVSETYSTDSLESVGPGVSIIHINPSSINMPPPADMTNVSSIPSHRRLPCSISNSSTASVVNINDSSSNSQSHSRRISQVSQSSRPSSSSRRVSSQSSSSDNHRRTSDSVASSESDVHQTEPCPVSEHLSSTCDEHLADNTHVSSPVSLPPHANAATNITDSHTDQARNIRTVIHVDSDGNPVQLRDIDAISQGGNSIASRRNSLSGYSVNASPYDAITLSSVVYVTSDASISDNGSVIS